MKRKKNSSIDISGKTIPIHSFSTLIVGSGAAGLNCAVHLYDFGVRDICIVTEGINRGTSRNSGSDKQTYYKLNVGGTENDSVRAMALSLFQGGAMDGDTALCEAALSWKEFAHLAEIGVPFPHNRWGEYVGYQTDHDTSGRGSSAGPLTSRMMTECLENEVRKRGIRIHDKTRIIKLLVQGSGDDLGIGGALGIVRNQERFSLVVYTCGNIVYATGGPAGMYGRSVYPLSQGGAAGTALRAGVRGKNLTESQFGIASRAFRWNLSGTYQQVLPAYVSTDQNREDEKEFLLDCFPDTGTMLTAQFLKGYQWPFTASRVENHGSSLIDLAVYHETAACNRKVFLDYTRNPGFSGEAGSKLDFSLLSSEAYSYLEQSGALFGTPVDRLIHMNEPAYDLYISHNIDIKKEMLEIGVCAQHNNGGLEGNIWWESNIRGFFPIGEANGSHGVYRPGGAALNSGQVGGYRAAEYISRTLNRTEHKPISHDEIRNQTAEETDLFIRSAGLKQGGIASASEMRMIRERMDRAGSIIRDRATVEQAIHEAREQYTKLRNAAVAREDILKYFILIDHVAAQIAYLEAIGEYIVQGGVSRGSYLILDESGIIPAAGFEQYRFKTGDDIHSARICTLQADADLDISFRWRDVRPLPPEDQWFETVWKEFREGEIFEDIQ